MKILFTTNKKEAVSTILNLQNLEKLNTLKDVEFFAFREDFEDSDVVLMMGYDHDIPAVRRVNPKAIVGVIDPRPPKKEQPVGADFVLANGIEMQDYYYRFTSNVFNYYIYPDFEAEKQSRNDNKIILAYHGNKIHIEEAHPRITEAIEKLGESYDIELIVIYNSELGKLSWKAKNYAVSFVPWSENVYAETLSKSDIGIIPGLMPIKNAAKVKKRAASFRRKFNEHETDYLLRFKSTSNPGRIFPFMRLGIPVVADMFPSALQIIDDAEDSFVACSSESWCSKLKLLIGSKDLRNGMGKIFQNKFYDKYNIDIMNRNLIDFLRTVIINIDKR